MNLVDFTRTLPAHWATAPIYAYGVQLPPKPGEEPRTALGKSPLGRASHEKLSPKFSAQWIKERSDQFQAIGVYTGVRSGGLVIFDVDRNLGAIQEKWGDDLAKAPAVFSPKEHAAKYLFIVPEEDRLKVESISHAAAGQEGWEVLWGAQGVLYGAYKDKGQYTLHGDLYDIPEAPEWLLERMREQYRKINERKTARKFRDTRYATRSREEKIAIAESCLSVIEPRGAFSERFWWEIGAMINSELPGEDGLKLWEEWSRRDIEYAEAWENGKNPCASRWAAGFSGTGWGFGSLIHEADAADPDRARFQRDGIAQLVEEIQAQPIKYKQDFISGAELLERAAELERTIEDPALLDQAKHELAADAGRAREGATAIDRLLDAHITFKRNANYEAKDITELDDADFEYIIPGILPKPWLLLVHADGGTGKSAMCQTLCKHITQAKPFEVYGAMEELPAGKCLWLNGDQSARIVRRQFEAMGVDSGVKVVGEWDMSWYSRFKRLQGGGQDESGVYTPGNYDLVVIDSLDGCNDSNPYEENRREFALPLKRLARRNGQDFGACTIIVIHHNNKNGGFRGTTAIKAAVDETWNMTRLDNKQIAELGIPPNSRLITVEKSRDDREGTQMLFTLLPDFTYRISAAPEPKEMAVVASPNQLMKDVLGMMRSTGQVLCLKDLVEDQVLGGVHKRRALEHVLKRLHSHKLIERCDVPAEFVKKAGRKPVFYRATGEIKKKPFTTLSHARGVSPGKSAFKDSSVIPVDSNHTGVSENTLRRKSTDEPGTSPDLISDDPYFPKAVGIETPSAAREEVKTAFSHVIREDEPLNLDCPFD